VITVNNEDVMPTTSIDDLLINNDAARLGQQIPDVSTPAHEEEVADVVSPYEGGEPESVSEEMHEVPVSSETSYDETVSEPESVRFDDYGNEKEDLSEKMQKRLQRQAENMKRQHEAEMQALRQQLTIQQQKELQQATRNFESDPNSDQSWQDQLDAYIRNAYVRIKQDEVREQETLREQRIQADFEKRLVQGIERFADFREIITALPCEISNPMTYATRSMEDPAAFLYAAAKRHPQELERIAKLADPVAQIAEMGRLEERMRKAKPTTQAPRPIGRQKEDSLMTEKKAPKEPSFDEILAQSDAKRLANMRNRNPRR
jgi:hypothetical protein